MKKTFFIDSGIQFLYVFSACILNLLISGVALKMIDTFVLLDYSVLCIIRMAVSAIAVAGILGALTYMLSYRKASFSAGYFSGTFFAGVALQLAVSLLFKFRAFISGGVMYLAGIFEHGTALSAEGWEYVGIIDYLLAFLIFTAVYYLTCVVCGKVAVKKRLRDRAELIGENN